MSSSRLTRRSLAAVLLVTMTVLAGCSSTKDSTSSSKTIEPKAEQTTKSEAERERETELEAEREGGGRSPEQKDEAERERELEKERSKGKKGPTLPKSVHNDVSPPLRTIKPLVDGPGGGEGGSTRDEFLPHPTGTPKDGAIQSSKAPIRNTLVSGTGFLGIGKGFSGPAGAFTVNSAPPDTNSAIGPNHLVENVNSAFAIFNKTGTVLYGPAATNTLWSGFGGGCQTNNDGDGIVRYDRAADRWIISQFSVSTTPYLECVAVSTTGDPTGSYYRYSFQYADFPDYPKMGIWPDGYYVTYNMFTGGTTFAGTKVCAMDRAKMLLGQAATQQCFNTSTSYGGLIPADLDSATAPPAGAPNISFGLGLTNTTLAYWKFHVDWGTPANSTFTGPTSLAVSSYTTACGASGTCVPQSGGGSLDSLSDRLMNRLAYRNFGDHESMVFTHSVTAGSSVGVRWYEIRLPGGNPSVYQQSTYAPDASYRWMGSAAMDKVGNIGMAYSLSSSSLKPSIVATGRLAGDPLGTMTQAETTLQTGAGAQGASLTRWGDYASITVDPTDDCTMWMSTEYLTANGTFNWSTRNASFQLPGCTNTVPGAPTIGTATAGNASAGLTWSAPANNGGTSITGYTVTPYIGASAQTAQTFNDTLTSHTITGLTNGTAYTFKVAAINGLGTGAQSAASNSVTPTAPATAPGAPTIGTATAGNAQAGLTWTAPGSDGGSAITGYVVTPYIGASAQTAQTFNDTLTSHTITGLTNGTAYTFKVAAINAVGTGNQSAASNSVTPATTPGAPTIGSATAGAGSASVSWTAPGNDGGSSITGYVVTPYIGASAQSPSLFDASQTTRTVSGLTNGTAYTFKVAAVNGVGTGSQSGASNSVTPIDTAGAPTGVSGVSGDSQVVLSWTAPASDGGSAITGYVVTPFIGAAALTPQTFNSTATTQNITGLTNGTAYTFTVAAVNGAGTGADSTMSAAVTPATVPDAPTIGTATGGNAQASLTWTAPGFDGGSAITGYVVTPYIGASAQSPSLFDASATTRTITGLTNGTAYTFKVAAVNAAGTGADSSASNAVTPSSSTAPGAPTVGKAIPGNGTASLSWTAPGSNGGSAITGYVVTPSISGVPQSPVTFNSTATTQTITGLTNGTTYTFTVSAKNAIGTGAPSADSNTVTAGAPGLAAFQSAQPGNASAKVGWFAPVANGSPITGYVITPYIGSTAQTPQTFNTTAVSDVVAGLTNGTTYTFRIAAFNANGTGPEAITNSVIVGTPTAPGLPYANPGSTTARVAWLASVANGSPVTSYTITPVIGSTPQTPQVFNSAASAQTVTGLTSGVSYTFRIAATNSVGTGPIAETKAIIVGSPGAPVYQSAAPGNAGAKVQYFVPAANSAPIISYTVWPVQGSTVLAPQVFNTPSATQLTVTGLTNGTTYTFRIAATNSVGTGPYSVTNSVVAGTPVAPPFPQAQPANGAAKVSWLAGADNGSAITSYVITPYIGSTAQAPQTFNSTALSQTVTGLTNGTTYTFRVVAVNGVGAGLVGTTPTAVMVGAPTSPAFPTTKPGNTTATLSWVGAVANGSPITAYVITPMVGTTAKAPQTFNSAATTQTVVGLTNGTTYTFRIAAVNGVGTGPYATTSSVKVGVPATPAKPTAVAGAGSATVTWVAPAANASAITGYIVTPYKAGVAQPQQLFDASTTSRTISSLTTGSSYTFTVIAVNGTGSSSASPASTAVIPT